MPDEYSWILPTTPVTTLYPGRLSPATKISKSQMYPLWIDPRGVFLHIWVVSSESINNHVPTFLWNDTIPRGKARWSISQYNYMFTQNGENDEIHLLQGAEEQSLHVYRTLSSPTFTAPQLTTTIESALRHVERRGLIRRDQKQFKCLLELCHQIINLHECLECPINEQFDVDRIPTFTVTNKRKNRHSTVSTTSMDVYVRTNRFWSRGNKCLITLVVRCLWNE